MKDFQLPGNNKRLYPPGHRRTRYLTIISLRKLIVTSRLSPPQPHPVTSWVKLSYSLTTITQLQIQRTESMNMVLHCRHRALALSRRSETTSKDPLSSTITGISPTFSANMTTSPMSDQQSTTISLTYWLNSFSNLFSQSKSTSPDPTPDPIPQQPPLSPIARRYHNDGEVGPEHKIDYRHLPLQNCTTIPSTRALQALADIPTPPLPAHGTPGHIRFAPNLPVPEREFRVRWSDFPPPVQTVRAQPKPNGIAYQVFAASVNQTRMTYRYWGCEEGELLQVCLPLRYDVGHGERARMEQEIGRRRKMMLGVKSREVKERRDGRKKVKRSFKERVIYLEEDQEVE
ncbi:hypothetical protein BT63DRAFT_458340 [Microthyrium microscopicum]|uniref:Uncharacterized protein n=1 Tax=Microthyrium microscopicum TaxID=703497 RepID=A0A6A6U4C2_9PEZI|nr:hypothetical protein BT63DRAFT_458340 [Microthyrium microscopicum]